MLTFETAVEIANSYLKTLGPKAFGTTDLKISIESVRRYDQGWVFPYNTKKFLESKQPVDGLVGNRPLFVDRTDGSLHLIPAVPIDEWLENYADTKT